MPQATSNNYFSKPAVGGDTDTWGSTLNTNWDTVDSVLAGDTDIKALNIVSTTSAAPLICNALSATDIAATFTGLVGIGTTTPDQKLQVDGNIRLGDTATGVDDDEDYGLTTGGQLTIHANDSGDNVNYTGLVFDVGNASGAQAATSRVVFKVNNTERVRIDSSGNVGIGTDSPQRKLHVESEVRIQGTYPKLEFVDTDNNPDFTIIGGNAQLQFYDETNATSRMNIDTSGNVGIGTSNPSVKLQVAGDATFDGGTSTTVNVLCDDAGNATLNLMGGNQGTGRLYVGQSAAYGGGIEYNGDSVPVTSGAGSDQIALYRRSDGTSHWTARNAHSNNDWEFRGKVTADELAGTLAQSIFNQIYPVGAVYISTSSTSPQTLFGGTWTAIGGGRVLQTVSGSTPAAGQNYGDNSRAISTANLPSHSHSFTDFTFQESISHGGQTGQGLSQGLGSGDSDSDNYPARPRSATTGTTGSGTNFDVRQASYGVYMWKRASLA